MASSEPDHDLNLDEAVRSGEDSLVFVYGSLLSGSDDLFHNHRYFLGQRDEGGEEEPRPVKVCDAVTEAAGFVMVSRVGSAFPYVLDRKDLLDAMRACAPTPSSSSPVATALRSPRVPAPPAVAGLGAAAASASAPSSTRVVGEVWRVGPRALEELDDLEGHPRFYRRRPEPVLQLAPTPSPRPSASGDALSPTSLPPRRLVVGMYVLSPEHRECMAVADDHLQPLLLDHTGDHTEGKAAAKEGSAEEEEEESPPRRRRTRRSSLYPEVLPAGDWRTARRESVAALESP